MSNYQFTARNKETGEEKVVMALDDFYGKHEYAYRVDGHTLNEVAFRQEWERVEDTSMTPDKVEEIVENFNHHLYNGYDTFAKKHLRQALTQYHQQYHQDLKQEERDRAVQIIKDELKNAPLEVQMTKGIIFANIINKLSK